jgi:hypothetical protein
MPLEPPYHIAPNSGDKVVALTQVAADEANAIVFALADGQTHIRLADLGNLPPVLGPHAGWSPLDTGADLAAWGVALVLLAAFGALVLGGLFRGRHSLDRLIAEPDGKASLSRFQALVFTFAFVVAFMTIVLRTGTFPREVPWEIMVILGGSLGTYVAAKYIGSGHAAGEPLGAAGGARMVWFSPAGKPVGPFEPAAQAPGGAPPPTATTFQLRAIANEPAHDDYRVIAVAVGGTRLTVAPLLPAEHRAHARLRYVDAEHKQVEGLEVKGPVTIETDPERVSEVAAAIVSDRPGELIAVEVRLA